MLETLCVKNYVLIDNLELEFEGGFSCITGETGSGKSIILGALSLLLGDKADKNTIRAGAEYAQISGCFSELSDEAGQWCELHGIIVEDSRIAINRIIKANGRSSYTINGTPVTRAEGSELGAMLIDIASQHASQALLKNDVLISMVDEASSSAVILAEYRKVYLEYIEKEQELKRVKEVIAKASEEQEYIKYCLGELEKAELRIGEEEELKSRASIMESSEYIAEAIYKANEELDNASSAISEALSFLSKASRKDPKLSEFSDRLDSDSIELDDILSSLKEYQSRITFSENELDSINSRLSEIQKIKRRFGGSVERALEIKAEYEEKLLSCEQQDTILSSLSEAAEDLKDRAVILAHKLSFMREKGALKLSKLIEENLHVLGMPSSRFSVRVNQLKNLGPYGYDDVSFRISANKGEKEADIQNSSSGGELSRILLAIKAALEYGNIGITMFFDEIDSGLGGSTANSVAEKLCELSKNHQVFTITHLAQIAAKASFHYLVYKEEIDGRTISRIKRIEGHERISEIARLLSGDESRISMEHAEALLNESREFHSMQN